MTINRRIYLDKMPIDMSGVLDDYLTEQSPDDVLLKLSNVSDTPYFNTKNNLEVPYILPEPDQLIDLGTDSPEVE